MKYLDDYDNYDHHFIGEGYFCNFDELPDVVGCSRKSGQTLRSMGYRDIRAEIRKEVSEQYEKDGHTLKLVYRKKNN